VWSLQINLHTHANLWSKLRLILQILMASYYKEYQLLGSDFVFSHRNISQCFWGTYRFCIQGTMKIEAVCCYEKVVNFYQTTQFHFPEEYIFKKL
jgi:hypothetical protein